METDTHFHSLTEACPSGSPVKEPSLQVPLTELPWREMPHSYSPPEGIGGNSIGLTEKNLCSLFYWADFNWNEQTLWQINLHFLKQLPLAIFLLLSHVHLNSTAGLNVPQMLLHRVWNRIYFPSDERIFSLSSDFNPPTWHCLAESNFEIWQAILQWNKRHLKMVSEAATI